MGSFGEVGKTFKDPEVPQSIQWEKTDLEAYLQLRYLSEYGKVMTSLVPKSHP
jgi:hypothetical protein